MANPNVQTNITCGPGKKTTAKSSKSTAKVSNKIIYSRVSYLYQAAAYLATQQQHSYPINLQYAASAGTADSHENSLTTTPQKAEVPQLVSPVSRRLISDLHAVALKGQIRISPTMKASICKKCDSFLVDGSTCTSRIENKSKGGKKPWADILVRTCNTCGHAKRLPLASERQKRKTERITKMGKESEDRKG